MLPLTLLLCMATSIACAQPRQFHCEVGLQGGCGYYVGDATPHIFMNVREAYGAHFRYKFDQRWAIQVKGLTQRLTGPMLDNGRVLDTYWQTQMVNLDAMAEFNFFRFGAKEYDKRVKPLTPYIFLGVGCSLYGRDMLTPGFYIPLGFGLKWKFSQRFGLNLAWQHNVYVADNLEGVDNLNNTYKLNGSNIFNCDIAGQLTLGIVFEFAPEKKNCKYCN